MENLIVRQTKNYGIFNTMSSNRQVNLNHVKNIMKSMIDNGVLCNPIIVNEKFEVIDGQHRLRACKDLDLPVYYLQIDNYNIKEVHALNLNQKNWSNQDYLEAYASDGNVNYQRILKFQQENKNFQFNTILSFITGVSGFHLKDSHYSCQEKRGRKSKVTGIGFREGRMQVNHSDIVKAQILADRINTLNPIYDYYNNNAFVGDV